MAPIATDLGLHQPTGLSMSQPPVPTQPELDKPRILAGTCPRIWPAVVLFVFGLACAMGLVMPGAMAQVFFVARNPHVLQVVFGFVALTAFFNFYVIQQQRSRNRDRDAILRSFLAKDKESNLLDPAVPSTHRETGAGHHTAEQGPKLQDKGGKSVSRSMRPVCLFVDCDDDTVQAVQPVFNSLGVASDVCRSAMQAVSRVSRSKVDALILQCRAPGSGVNAIEMLRTIPAGASMIVVAVIEDHNILDECLRAGANFVLLKPFDPDITSRTLRAAYGLMFAERRRYFRHSVAVPVALTGPSGTTVNATMKNISDHGMAVQCCGQLKAHQKTRVRYRIPGSDFEVDTPGEVVWTNAEGTAGIRLFIMDEATREHVDRWLSALARSEGSNDVAPAGRSIGAISPRRDHSTAVEVTASCTAKNL
jgi:CheY-like chemotaxis protein